ncbi:hypothetical protein BC939DRAFT_488707 [Gamsiella multidivaricata]|uniref:uncharacterized protein n=1 Tax=Gamsiella multidivaricata TaxID=101098 RepID=UPI00222030F9|nr:uncharacterized protein BC939DRAFT_488707 [Gamsiella multidivaricata]KAI7832174.1 hypothetical protein BC939DRAFT_488707 [Gamsiella multidivaricata]
MPRFRKASDGVIFATFYWFFFLGAENNRYRNTTYVTGRSPLADRTFGEYQHAFVQDNSVAWLTSTLETTRVLRSDFLGLFGLYNDSATIYDVKSNAEVILDQNKTHIYYQFPNMQIESRQVLLLSIPEAISSWGGAFSIILSIFYALFGKGAFSPFGIIQKSVLRNGTRAKIASVYTNGRKGNNENNNDKSNSLTYLDNNKQDARDTNAPLPFVLGGANYQPCQQDLTALHQQQQEIHHEELVALRQQIRALRQDVSHLQRHEQRVKEFYLDMELMETADVAPGATMPEFGQPTSERPFTSGKSDSLSGGEGHNVRQRKGWAQKLFNNEAEFQEVPREETLALRRAEHGMGGYTQHTQQTDPTPENVHWSAGSGRDANIEMRPI